MGGDMKKLIFLLFCTGMQIIAQEMSFAEWNQKEEEYLEREYGVSSYRDELNDHDAMHRIQQTQNSLYRAQVISDDTNITVQYDTLGNPVVLQPYIFDSKITLKYIISSESAYRDTVSFPQDFLLEVPSKPLPLNPALRLDQISVLGTHNCFTNRAEGFLYYQQGESTYNQFVKGGARMLRPAWHNPSGSPIDAPNKEPILCHASEEDCKTVSLATRGFKKHETVHSHLQLVKKLLDNNPDEILIIGVNNYLSSEDTDEVIEKVAGLKEMLVNMTDIQSEDNQRLWGGSWPTVQWMRDTHKRLMILNSSSAFGKYTVPYDVYVRMNQYGTVDMKKAATPRHGNKENLDKVGSTGLVEISWFQEISLDESLMDAVESAINFYQKMRMKIREIEAQSGSFVKKLFLNVIKQIGLPADYFEQKMSFENIEKAMSKVLGALSIVERFGPFKYLVKMIKGKKQSFKEAMQQIKNYIPKQQDNSVKTLSRLIALCRKNGIILDHQIPNIVLLDFATTQGQGGAFVNIINILQNQKLGFAFTDIKGLAIGGKEIYISKRLVL